MAHKKDYKPEDILFPNQTIVQSELVHEMQSSYIDYAMSVIVGRALPDVRDGLKPVHVRRRPDERQAVQKIGDVRRRRAGPIPSARRRIGLRRDGASGAGLFHALYAR